MLRLGFWDQLVHVARMFPDEYENYLREVLFLYKFLQRQAQPVTWWKLGYIVFAFANKLDSSSKQ